MESLKTLKTLVKLSKKNVEDKQKALASIRKQRYKLEDEKTQLQQKRVSEVKAAHKTQDPQLIQMAAAFEIRMQKNLQMIDQSIEVIQNQEEKAAEELQEAFAEQKRYEVLHDKAEAEHKKMIAKKEQEQLDDMASIRQSQKSDFS